MKQLFISFVMMASALSAMAKEITPMHIVEKASYQVAGLVTKGKIDPSYLTDITTLTVTKGDQGFEVVLLSPSADANTPNQLTIPFDLTGKAGTAVANFTSRYPQGPIFIAPNAATVLDLGAEAIVDHLNASPDNITIARTTQAVDLQKEATGVLLLVHLTDGRIYKMKMDSKGKVTEQGF